MFDRQLLLGFALLGTLGVTSSASAHFKLTSPASWLKEDAQGNPQKVSPCGVAEGTTTGLSGEVTTYHAGETIMVEWTDTIAHPGHFRIALAEDRKDLKDPDIKQDAQCSYDESLVPKEASGNVLADGVAFRSRNGFNAQAGMKFTQPVTLPDKPCDNCTLQVMQVMENDIQAISNCYYLHCANIKILPAESTSGSAGSSAGSAASAGTAASAGSPAAGSLAAAAQSGRGSSSTAGSSGAPSVVAQSGTGAAPPVTGNKPTTPVSTPSAAGTPAPAVVQTPTAASDASSSGCSIGAAGQAEHSQGLTTALTLLAGIVLRARRKTRRQLLETTSQPPF